MAINSITLPNVDASTNRISGSGYVYDANGNLIQDPQGRQFTFNGDNKQTQVKDANNQVIGQYFYDGSGKRIKKVTNTETTIFVYSGSKLIAEYSTQQSSTPTISYTATDMLGSPRVITDANGQVISRRDFVAFGEEIATNVGGRTTTSKYGQSDSVRQRFTGYQKDDETGLDFAEARYYNDAHGRFTAVDPLLASGKSTNPQTFNRYVYSMNRPLLLTDPSGMQAGVELKKNFDIKGQTYQPIIGTKTTIYPGTSNGINSTGPTTTSEPVEIGQTNVVATSKEVNDVLNKYASAVYTNDVIGKSAIAAATDVKGPITLKDGSFGVSLDFGVKGEGKGNIGASGAVGVTVEFNNSDAVEIARRTADFQLNVAARNELRGIKTVATDSPNTPRNLTEKEIDGLLNYSSGTASDAATKDVKSAQDNERKNRLQQQDLESQENKRQILFRQ